MSTDGELITSSCGLSNDAVAKKRQAKREKRIANARKKTHLETADSSCFSKRSIFSDEESSGNDDDNSIEKTEKIEDERTKGVESEVHVVKAQ